MDDDRKRFTTYAAAWHKLVGLRHWPDAKVVCMHEPDAKEAGLAGEVFLVEAAPGRFLRRKGGVK